MDDIQNNFNTASSFLTDMLANTLYGKISGNDEALRRLLAICVAQSKQLDEIAAAVRRIEANQAPRNPASGSPDAPPSPPATP